MSTKRVRVIAGTALLSIAVIGGASACTTGATQQPVDKAAAKSSAKAAPKAAKPAASKETKAQANARQSAEDYLNLSAFSRDGLIDQLVQGADFNKADATYGVDAQHANWNEQAAKDAQSYLDMTSFSHKGLVDQLVQGAGFTKSQAEYGVSKAGL